MLRVRGFGRQHDAIDVRQQFAVRRRVAAAGLVPPRQVRQFNAQNRALEAVHAGVPAHFGVEVFLRLPVIAEHPEYAALVEQGEDALLREWGPDGGAVNPFLHMGMHLALREQVATDRPAGIAAIHRRLAAAHGPYEAEHRMMECLGEALWLAQRSGVMPDERAYLEALRRLPG